MKHQAETLRSDGLLTLLYRNPYLLGLSILLILTGGLLSLDAMPRLEDPRLMNRNPVITTIVPGASASRVEALVTEKIERSLKEVGGIKTVESVSRAGVSVITVELEDAITDNQPVFTRIRDKLSAVASELPPEAMRPEFDEQRGAVAFALVAGLTWTGQDEAPLGVLHRLAEDLADRLRNVAGTQLVRLYGAPHEEILVVPDACEMAALGLEPGALAGLIRGADSKTPAGIWRASSADLRLEVSGELDSVRRIEGIPVRTDGQGGTVRVADLARVKRGYRDPPDEIAWVDGQRSVLVAARVKETSRTDQWRHQAETVLQGFGQEIGGNLSIGLVFDQTGYTNARLSELGANLAAGAGVILLVVLVLMGWRSALVVGAALPLSLGLTLFGIAAGSGALHQMSIFGMMIAIGLLIDNAIVVVDEVNKHLREGCAPLDAISSTIRHLFAPLTASTLTTVLAFMPIVLLTGNTGEFVGSIGVSVILALLASYLVAFTLTPALAARWSKPTAEPAAQRWWHHGFRSQRGAVWMRRLLVDGLRVPLWMAVLAASLPLVGFAFSSHLGNQFFPLTDRDMFALRMWLPSEASIEHTAEQARRVEALLRQQPEIQHVHWLVGGSFPSVYYNLVMNQDRSPHFAQAVITAGSSRQVKALVPRLQRELDATFPGLQLVVRSFAQGPPVDAEIAFRVSGPSLAAMRDAGDQLRRIMIEHPSILHTRATLAGGEPKIWFRADEDEVRLAGLSLIDISQQLQTKLEGSTGGTVMEDTKELPVRVRYSSELRGADVPGNGLNLVNSRENGAWIPLSNLGSFELGFSEGAIARRNGIRVNVVDGFTRNGALPIDVTRQILARVNAGGVQLPAGTAIEVGGEAEQEQKAVGSLRLYAPLLVVLMVGTMILSFQSLRLALLLGLVAGLSVGLGLLATWCAGLPISFNTLLGIAGLIGLALNDNIVVLAAIRANPRARAGDIGAIVNEVMGCLRHVFSTTLTTVGGFLPLLIFVGGDFWPPLAIVLSGGVVGSTLLAIFFVPAFYRVLFARTGNAEAPGMMNAAYAAEGTG